MPPVARRCSPVSQGRPKQGIQRSGRCRDFTGAGELPLDEFCKELGLPYEESPLARIASETRTAGVDIIDAKGATYYGIGAALVRIIRAILRNERAILTVSSRVPQSMQLGEVSLSLPSIVDRQGIARVLSVALNSSERKALEESAEVVKRNIATLSQRISI